MTKTYVLSRDVSHFIDTDRDAWLEDKFPSWENVALSLTRDYDIPNPVEFWAFFDAIENSDFPATTPQWPIVSKKMLRTLLDVGDFPHRTYPIKMVDSELVDIIDGQNIASGKVNNEFVAVQLMEHLELFDWNNSKYTVRSFNKNKVRRIKKLVLKKPNGGLPPIFRIKAKSYLLFATEAAKEALESNNIQRVKFTPTEQFVG